MAERRTLAQLRCERDRKGNSLNVEVVGEALWGGVMLVWQALRQGEGQSRAVQGWALLSLRDARTCIGSLAPLAACCCAFCLQDMKAGRVVVLAVSPVDISDINCGQLGTNKGAPGTAGCASFASVLDPRANP